MLLTTPVQSPEVDILSTAFTVVQPGDLFSIKINITAKQDCELRDISWQVPQSLAPESNGQQFPVTLAAGESIDIKSDFSTDATREDFGEIRLSISLRVEAETGGEKTVESVTWLSIFTRQTAADPDQLQMALRQRLLDVVNVRPLNGHIFLADYEAFFTDFLNVEIAAGIAAGLAEEFGLPIEGLPLDAERRMLIIHGKMSFYGIEKLELLAIEDCEESDDRFDPDDARETINQENNHA